MVVPDEIQKLKSFISEVSGVIDLVVSNLTDINPGAEGYRKDIEDAWKLVQPRLQMMSEYLEGKGDKPVEEIVKELEVRGLLGLELELKLRLYRERKVAFDAAWQEFSNASEEEKKTEKRSWFGGFWDRLRRIIQRLLRSLASFVPGGDAVDEFKGVLEEFT